MKKLVFYLLCLTFMRSLYANDLASQDLKGKVKEIVTEHYDMVSKFGKWEQVFKGKRNIIYDTKGNELSSASYNSNGLLEWKIISVYDVKGNKIEVASYKPDGSLSDKMISIYDLNA